MRQWDQQLFEFETYGFAVLPAVLDPESSSRLSDRLDLLDEQRGIDYVHDNAFARHVSSVYADDDDFMSLIDHPDVLGFIESVLGAQLILGSCNARIVRPGDPLQGFHSDIPSQLRRSGAPVMVNAVWMLDPFTEENGATRFVPGSHLARVRHSPAGRHGPPRGAGGRTRRQRPDLQRSVLARGRGQQERRGPAGRLRPLPGQPLDALRHRSVPLGFSRAMEPHDDRASVSCSA